MAELPLLLFPSKRIAPREKRPTPINKELKLPPRAAQIQRLASQLAELEAQLQRRDVSLRDNPGAAGPDEVLVIEIWGALDGFINAAQKLGFECFAELEGSESEPEDGFVMEDDGVVDESQLIPQKLFVFAETTGALRNILSLWKKHEAGRLKRKEAQWGHLFDQIKILRQWDVQDRLESTGAVENWQDRIANNPTEKVPLTIELWYHATPSARAEKQQSLTALIEAAEGRVLRAWQHAGIRYHALKVELPIAAVQSVLDQHRPGWITHPAAMYVRPVAQFSAQVGLQTFTDAAAPQAPPQGEPIVALLDGLPFMRHERLDGRLRLDDPEDFARHYQPEQMTHGTAMASLIVHDELDAQAEPLQRPVYVRPVLVPEGKRNVIAEDEFPEDLIVRAVTRMFKGPTPAAPFVRIINLSVGDDHRPFDRALSPWAKVLDWLAWEHKVLFCVSAGNCGQSLATNLGEDAFKALDDSQKTQRVLDVIHTSRKERRVLSPAEAINIVTVGALHHDHSTLPAPNPSWLDPIANHRIASPVSRLGSGYRGAIKPDVLFAGGRQPYAAFASSPLRLIDNVSTPGQRTAMVSSASSESTNHSSYSRGTSNACALASRAAARIHQMLETLPVEGSRLTDRPNTIAALLKTLLAHGAGWGESAAPYRQLLKGNQNIRRDIAAHLGYGACNVERVLRCTEQRATLIASDEIRPDEVHHYELPLPLSLSNELTRKNLVVTLAWLTPMNATNLKHRGLRLELKPGGADKTLQVGRSDVDSQQAQKGTIQHEVMTGADKVAVYQDGARILLSVVCRGEALASFDEAVPYGLAVTLEAPDSTLPIYSEIKQAIAIMVNDKVRV